jgi:hypothetical protein
LTETVVDRLDEAMGKLLGRPGDVLAMDALKVLGNEVPRLRKMAKDLHQAHLDLIEKYGTPGYNHALLVIQESEMALAGDQAPPGEERES